MKKWICGIGLSVLACVACAENEGDLIRRQICSQVASDLNDGTEASRDIRFADENPDLESRLDALGWSQDAGLRSFVELELEGKKEIFQEVNEGGTCASMQIVRVKAPSEGQTTEDVIESQTETEMDIAWGAASSLRWVGKHLVSILYSGTSANLYLEDGEGRHQLCTLDSKETHKYIVSSSDDALCNAARNDELMPYPERKIRLSQDDLQKWGIKDEGTSVSTFLVDGHEISVASIPYSSGVSCSREVGWGAELDEHDRIIDSTLTRALLGMTDRDKEADFWRYESVKFFEFEGRAVVVHKRFSDINVAFVEPTGFKPVCSLVERRQFTFSGP